MDILDLKASAIARAAKVLKTGGNLSTTPIYSRVRCMANLGPALKMFDSSLHVEAAADLRAFDYRKGAVASAGGFGASTTATIRHTNVTTEGEVPNGGDAFVTGFEILALGLRKPGTTNTADATVNDSIDTSVPARDVESESGAVSAVQGLILTCFSDVYVPYVQKAGKAREYLGALSFERVGRIFKAEIVFPEGWIWGKGEKLALGFERRSSITNKTKATSALYSAIIDTGLDGTTADNTDFPALQDFVVQTIGARFDPGAAA